MRPNWQRISSTEYRLDEVWTVRRLNMKWRAYRRGIQCWAAFTELADAMAEAERLRKEDEAYR